MSRYNKSIIYKLCCKDVTITDIYVGSACNFAKRKNQHKSDCTNETSKGYNFPVYKFIRENGGWENWDMIQLLQFSCETKRERETKEREYVDLLKATLNKQLPTRTQKEYYEQNKDDIKDLHKQYYEQHKEEIKANAKEYREQHKQEIKETKRLYYQEHKKKIQEKRKKLREEKKLSKGQTS